MVMQSVEALVGGAVLVTLVAAGVALTIYGLRQDRRERRRAYQRRWRPGPDASRKAPDSAGS